MHRVSWLSNLMLMMNMKKIYLKPEVITLELSMMDCLMVSGFDETMSDMPQPGAPARQDFSIGGKVKVF